MVEIIATIEHDGCPKTRDVVAWFSNPDVVEVRREIFERGRWSRMEMVTWYGSANTFLALADAVKKKFGGQDD